MNAAENFQDISQKMFSFYKGLADKSMALLSEAEIHHQPNGESNSIAILVKHLSGNMLSRFTDFLTSDGEKEWRNRDDEFEDTFASKAEMLAAWDKGWECLFANIAQITPAQMTEIVYIRNEGHTVLEAITRQVAHYAYHVGQIVYLAKILKNEKWQSLSIAKGQSASFNKTKFDQEKERKFFVDGE